MTRINVKCVDQVLTFLNTPIISAGDQNVDIVAIDFDDSWTGFGKMCIFYRQKGESCYSLVDSNNEALIPCEVLKSDGIIYFGVMGIQGNKTKTSNVLAYRVLEGAFTEVEDPSEDVFTQILSGYGKVATELDNLKQEMALHIYEEESDSVEFDKLVDDSITSESTTWSSKHIDETFIHADTKIENVGNEIRGEISARFDEIREEIKALTARVSALE